MFAVSLATSLWTPARPTVTSDTIEERFTRRRLVALTFSFVLRLLLLAGREADLAGGGGVGVGDRRRQ